MAAGGEAWRQGARPSPRIGRYDLIDSQRVDGSEEEEVRRFAWVAGAWARVEHVERAVGPTGPGLEGLDGRLEVAARHDSLVYLSGVTPRDGERPVGLAAVAYGLLEQPGLVGGSRRHEVARGLHAVHGREDGLHRVEVVEGHEGNFWVGREIT